MPFLFDTQYYKSWGGNSKRLIPSSPASAAFSHALIGRDHCSYKHLYLEFLDSCRWNYGSCRLFRFRLFDKIQIDADKFDPVLDGSR